MSVPRKHVLVYLYLTTKKVVNEQCGLIFITIYHLKVFLKLAMWPTGLLIVLNSVLLDHVIGLLKKKIISPVPMSKLHLAIGRVPIGSRFIHAKHHGRRCLSVRL